MFSLCKPTRIRVAVIGACGAVGRSLGLLLRQSPVVTDLRLVDIAPSEGVKGVAEDLSHIPSLMAGPQRTVTGFDVVHIAAALKDVQVIVCAAGVSRHKCGSMEEMWPANAERVHTMTTLIGRHAPPSAWLGITAGLNSMMPVAARSMEAVGAYHPSRLFGLTYLNTLRAQAYLCRETGVLVPEEELPVVGGQSGATIVPLYSHAYERVKSESKKMSQKLWQEVVEKTTVHVSEGGAAVTRYDQPSSLACAYGCYTFVERAAAVITGKQETLRFTSMVSSDRFTMCSFFSAPLLLDKDGVQSMLPLPSLSPYEEEQLDHCLHDLEKNVARGNAMYEELVREKKLERMLDALLTKKK